MKSILFFQSTLEYGGVRTVSSILSRAFILNGFKIIWLVGHKCYNDYRDYDNEFDIRYLPNEKLESEVNVLYYQTLLEKESINYVINQEGLYEPIHFLNNTGNYKPAIISVIHNNPTLDYEWLWHDAIQLRGFRIIDYLKLIARIVLYPRTKFRKWENIKKHTIELYKQKNIVCVLSESYIESYGKIYSPIVPLVRSIYNPLRYNYGQPVNFEKKQKIILYVGRLDNRAKKLFSLISIWRRTQPFIPDWSLLILGDGPDRKILEEKSKNIKNIFFLGYQDPKAYYEKGSILCMTSIFEGFPMTLIESMQYGCVPIVFNSYPAAKDIVKNGKNGILIKPFSEKEFSRELIDMARDKDKRIKFGIEAVNSIKAYTLECVMHSWYQVFREADNNI